MQRIKRQFGAKFAETLALSPTLMQDVAQMRAAGVTIRRIRRWFDTPIRNAAWSNPETKTISIARRSSRGYALTALAHEKVHVLDSPVPRPIPGVTGKAEYIEAQLNGELDAYEHQCVVIKELLDAGFRRLSPWDREIYSVYQKGGRKALRRWLNTAVTSYGGQRYPAFYAWDYDQSVKPAFRLP